jgi:hypothetical protein
MSEEHRFESGGGCMSRCRCGKTFSDPVHGALPDNIVRLQAALRHPYTCEWCDGEWPSQMAYADHFSSLTHKDPDHPYQLPERKEAR